MVGRLPFPSLPWFGGALLCVMLLQCGGGVEAETPFNPATDMGHGEDGAPVLSNAPDLRTSVMSVEERVAIIAYGKGTMPPHRDMLDMPTIRGLAVYIESFRQH